MRRRTTTTVLVMALLAQAASAFAGAPCSMPRESSPRAHPDAHADMVAGVMQGHAGHEHAMAPGAAEAPAPGSDCCDGMTAVDCATSGCSAGSGPLLLPPLPVVAAFDSHGAPYRDRDRPPPYLSPSGSIFRPPIA